MFRSFSPDVINIRNLNSLFYTALLFNKFFISRKIIVAPSFTSIHYIGLEIHGFKIFSGVAERLNCVKQKVFF